jgi:hypothetical protein
MGRRWARRAPFSRQNGSADIPRAQLRGPQGRANSAIFKTLLRADLKAHYHYEDEDNRGGGGGGPHLLSFFFLLPVPPSGGRAHTRAHRRGPKGPTSAHRAARTHVRQGTVDAGAPTLAAGPYRLVVSRFIFFR